MIQEISKEMLKLGQNHFIHQEWKKVKEIQLQDCYLVPIIIKAVHLIIKNKWPRMRNLIIRQRSKNHLLAHQNQDKLSHQVIKLITLRVTNTNKRMRTHFTVQKHYKSGNITTQTKKVSMEHLLISPSILRKERNKNQDLSNKTFGSKFIFNQ